MGRTSKYIEIADLLSQQIADAVFPDGRLPTEAQLCCKFSVSRPTVRQALALLEQRGLISKVQGSGTYINQDALVRSNPVGNNVGLIITYLDDYIYPPIINGIERVLRDHGYSLLLSITKNAVDLEVNAIRNMLSQNVCGLIVNPTKSVLPSIADTWYKQIEAAQVPCLFINSRLPNFHFSYVEMDDYAVGQQMTEYLIQHGHTKITGIFKADDLQGHQRYFGFLKCMQSHHIPLCSKSMFWYTTEDMNDIFSGDFDEIFWRRIKDCTAIVCYNDKIAQQIKHVILRKGFHVPKDYSVISVDNSRLAELYDLTSIDHPKEKMGMAAAEALLQLLEDPYKNVTKIFDAELIERGSVACCNME